MIFQGTRMVMSHDVVRALRELREEFVTKTDAPVDELFADVGMFLLVLCRKFGLCEAEQAEVLGVDVLMRLKGRRAK